VKRSFGWEGYERGCRGEVRYISTAEALPDEEIVKHGVGGYEGEERRKRSEVRRRQSSVRIIRAASDC
jgi:hypothetical protein